MKPVSSVIYRYLTHADFYNMYKPRDSEAGGGGQTYIDFPTQDVSVADWESFVRGIHGVGRESRAQGPAWTVPLRSIGLGGDTQSILIYQRRPQTVSVAKQTLGRVSTNRVEAWHPRNGFPTPVDPDDRGQLPDGLAVFLVRTADELWAGWFLNDGRTPLPADPSVRDTLQRLLTVPQSNRHRAGLIRVSTPTVWLDETDSALPFNGQLAEGATPARERARVATAPLTPLAPARSSGRRESERVTASDAQGRQLDPARRKAVEQYAMTLAKQAYPDSEDTSATESFDLRTYEAGVEVRVEVKGTVGAGEYVLVTTNEVENSRGSDWRTDLFVVSNIKLTYENGEYLASGGDIYSIRGWTAEPQDLTPTQYRYRVPR